MPCEFVDEVLPGVSYAPSRRAVHRVCECSGMTPDDSVQRLWDEHCDAPFPARLGGQEIAGVEMVMLDADIAGCVQTWLANKGQLDKRIAKRS